MTISYERVVEVAPERLDGWLDRFFQRHGQADPTRDQEAVTLICPDGAAASIDWRWPTPPDNGDLLSDLIATHTRERLVAALIVRRRGHAVGIFAGERMVTGRHDHHYAQGRTKAGGWSQQRYARRRANQAAHAYAEAVEDAAELLVDVTGLEGLVTGGDQAGVEVALGDRALASLADLPRIRIAGVPDPNASVLASLGARYRMVPIKLNSLA